MRDRHRISTTFPTLQKVIVRIIMCNDTLRWLGMVPYSSKAGQIIAETKRAVKENLQVVVVIVIDD